jgi:hypothetical protein
MADGVGVASRVTCPACDIEWIYTADTAFRGKTERSAHQAANGHRNGCEGEPDVETITLPAETAAAAHDEMDFTTTEGNFGQTFDTSIPAQLRPVSDPTPDFEHFHELLAEFGFASLDTHPTTERGEREFYDGEICSLDDYKRISIRTFRDGVVRIYPREDQPTVTELTHIIYALEQALDCTLEHDPIEDGETDE